MAPPQINAKREGKGERERGERERGESALLLRDTTEIGKERMDNGAILDD